MDNHYDTWIPVSPSTISPKESLEEDEEAFDEEEPHEADESPEGMNDEAPVDSSLYPVS